MMARMRRLVVLGLVAVLAGCGGDSSTSPSNRPLFTMAGTGDNVFDMPTSVSRVKITGDFAGVAGNFIVRVGGRLIVNELVGTGFQRTHFEGTYVTTAGVTEIVSSSGVAWTFTEVR